MRQKGYDMTARLRNKIPISDIRMKDNHEDQLDQELAYRHIPSYLPYGEKGKRVHPAPTTEKAIDHPWDKMTFSQKKDLLMVDEERRFRMDHAQENGFTRDVDMKNFDSKTFTVLNEDVVFEFPER